MAMVMSSVELQEGVEGRRGLQDVFQAFLHD